LLLLYGVGTKLPRGIYVNKSYPRYPSFSCLLLCGEGMWSDQNKRPLVHTCSEQRLNVDFYKKTRINQMNREEKDLQQCIHQKRTKKCVCLSVKKAPNTIYIVTENACRGGGTLLRIVGYTFVGRYHPFSPLINTNYQGSY
jgi:hypothetical protein